MLLMASSEIERVTGQEVEEIGASNVGDTGDCMLRLRLTTAVSFIHCQAAVKALVQYIRAGVLAYILLSCGEFL